MQKIKIGYYSTPTHFRSPPTGKNITDNLAACKLGMVESKNKIREIYIAMTIKIAAVVKDYDNVINAIDKASLPQRADILEKFRQTQQKLNASVSDCNKDIIDCENAVGKSKEILAYWTYLYSVKYKPKAAKVSDKVPDICITLNEIDEIVAGLPDEIEKIRVLYKEVGNKLKQRQDKLTAAIHLTEEILRDMSYIHNNQEY